MGLKLIKLDKSYQNACQEMINEWKADILKNHTNSSPWAIFRNDVNDFDYYLTHLENKDTSGGMVPDSTFFLVDEESKRLLGAVNIRHYLNEGLLSTGGHIGLGVRPSERKKGYATKMLALSIKECKKLGINKILITCNSDNIGSKKSILNNGGVLENSVIEDGVEVERYWINL